MRVIDSVVNAEKIVRPVNKSPKAIMELAGTFAIIVRHLIF